MDKNRINFLYVFPNLFTAASIFLGVVSIINATVGNYEKAAWLIALATIFDALDGRVARITHTTSKFGGEFDSLADVIAFGVAPALLLYFSYAADFGRFGITVVALYAIFGAVRLARFNVMSSDTDPNVFIGLPIPASALLVITWILIFNEYPILQEYSLVLVVLGFCSSILMVSNVRYPSFKKIDFSRANFVKGLIVLIVTLSMIFIYPVEALCAIITIYALYGVVRYFYTIITRLASKER